jgi:predicted ATPase/DNA-binding SARP family transcriptional activator
MSSLDLSLFGPPRALRDGVPVAFGRHPTLALLAYLAAADQPHGRDALAALFWPERDEQASHAALRRILYDLGRTIGKGWLELGDSHVQLRAQAGLRVDVRRFRELVARATAHGHAPQQLCDGCLVALVEAADLYRDDFLAGFTLRGSAEFDVWQTLTTENLRLELAVVLEKLASALVARRQYDLALPHARRWLALDPLNEASHCLLMQLHAASGDRAAAARQYEQCAGALASELGIEPAPETTALFHALVQGEIAGGRAGAALGIAETPASTPAAFGMAASRTPHNLPPDVTPFIGRQAVLGQVAERLADPACRLLTVLGPGGIGKTRLAVRAARDEMDSFPHGVYFVDLAPVPSAELLSAAILRTLQAPQQAVAGPDQHLLDFLKDKQMLLVLDNYEHLLTGPEPDRRDGYGLVAKMAATAPQLKILVTSRARLNVPQEWLAPLEGLETPPPSPRPSPFEGEGGFAPLPFGERSGERRSTGRRRRPAKGAAAALGRYSATALFLDRIRRLRPDFHPATEDARAMAHICRLLEGMPLAIELAAAWARILPLDEIARRLEGGLDLLTTTMRGVPSRQRSMVATFDHSWRLLTPRERSILRRLSVFRGGFTLEAAGAVAGAGLRDLANLADASWLAPATPGRYAIHELVRQYCAEKLEREGPPETGETGDQVGRRHAAYFESLLASRWEQFYTRTGVITETALDLGNLLAAWDWSLAHDDLPMVCGLSSGLGFLADRQGQNPEMAHVLGIGAERLRAAQAEGHNRERASVLALLLINQSERLVRVGRLGDAEACLEESAAWLGDASAGDARWAEARWFHRRMAAWIRYKRGDFARSSQLFREVAAEVEEDRVRLWPYTVAAAKIWLPEACAGMAYDAIAQGEYAEARRLAEEAVGAAERLGSGFGRMVASSSLVSALIDAGEYERVEHEAQRFLSAATRFGDALMIASALASMGRIQFLSGRHDRARAWWRRGAALARRTGLRDRLTLCLVGLGDIELALGNPTAARHYYQQSLAPAGQARPAGRPGALIALIGLGRVALHEGRPTEAREQLRQVLSAPGRDAPTTATAIVHSAEALLREGELVGPAELCGFLLSWRGAPRYTRDAAQKLVAEVEARLPPGDLAAALERGRGRQLEEVIAGIVGAQ